MKARNSVYILILIIFISCKKKSSTDEQPDEFDKTAMLSNYADNLIIPNLKSFKVSIDSLTTAFNDFKQTKTINNLYNVRQKYVVTYLKFQTISAFEFGPSETEIIRSNFNTYPTNTVQINSNITSGSYNLGAISNLDAKGLPAIDFLLFGKNETDAAIISLFDTDTKATNRISYFESCLSDMQSKTNTIVNSWGASYRGSFISSTGSKVGSSIGLMVNQLNFELDLIKNAKLGIPLGKKSLGTQLPEKCEAYYTNTLSVSLAKQSIANIENMYLGRSLSNADGLGFDDLLDNLKSQYGSQSLNSAIKNQFLITKSKLDLVSEPLSSSVINATATVDAAYLELVKLLVLLKTDVPSALGIVITYQDGDGD